jgi:O-antigen ligase
MLGFYNMSFKGFAWGKIEVRVVDAVVFMLPIFFLTIRGWSNSFSAVLLAIALFSIVARPSHYLKGRDTQFWILFWCLAMPFFAEFFVQLMRFNVVGSTLDGPSRFFFAAIVFIYLSRLNGDFAKHFAAGALIAVVTTALSVFFLRDYYWGTRAATYFVDPITLPVFLIGCLSISLLFLSARLNKLWLSVWLFILFFFVCTVSLLAYSRTAWLAIVTSTYLFLFLAIRKNILVLLGTCLCVTISLVLLLMESDLVGDRVYQGYYEFLECFTTVCGGSSIGIRMNLIQMDWVLFLNNLFIGVPDGHLPPIDWFAKKGIFVSPEAFDVKRLAGSHNEILAHLTRKGILGVVVVACLFCYPLYYFYRHTRDGESYKTLIAKSAFLFCAAIFVSGLSIQVFNLKMTATFYSFALAIFMGSLYKLTQRPQKFTNQDQAFREA